MINRDKYKSWMGDDNFYAAVVADSTAMRPGYKETGVRLTTVEVGFPHIILPQVLTHRQFSRNTSSSRAIPTQKLLDHTLKEGFIPSFWGKNQPGMQAEEETDEKVLLYGTYAYDRKQAWTSALVTAYHWAKAFANAGYHKQIVNRLLEPFSWVKMVITATEWENFFNLRLDHAAQPEIQQLAHLINDAISLSHPNILLEDEWHLPYVEDLQEHPISVQLGASTARCARVSYMNHDNSTPDLEKDIALYTDLKKAGHMSPFEHQAKPMYLPKRHEELRPSFIMKEQGITHVDMDGNTWSGNFREWIQHRQIEDYQVVGNV